MKPHKISLINAVILILISSWGYFSSETPSKTALIPAFIGLIILLLNKGLKKENKAIAHIIVLLTLIVLIGLIKPLTGAVERNDDFAIIRVGIMIISTLIALILFVKNFIDIRKNKVK
tara:strand:+ start:5853 stop:6206 length:354 start_codon:yes stop_codon:yes gene_type:complete